MQVKLIFTRKVVHLVFILKVRLFGTRILLDEVELNIVICQWQIIRKKPLKD